MRLPQCLAHSRCSRGPLQWSISVSSFSHKKCCRNRQEWSLTLFFLIQFIPGETVFCCFLCLCFVLFSLRLDNSINAAKPDTRCSGHYPEFVWYQGEEVWSGGFQLMPAVPWGPEWLWSPWLNLALPNLAGYERQLLFKDALTQRFWAGVCGFWSQSLKLREQNRCGFRAHKF